MLLAIPSSLFAQAEIRLEAVPSVVHPGDAFTIEVHVDLLGAQTIGGGEIGIEFDTQTFTLTGLETPLDLAGPVIPDLFVWNGPPPVGAGGITGCNLWWDGLGSDAIATTFAFTSGTTESSFLLFRFELTAATAASIGTHSLFEPAVDLTCLWSGSMLVQPSGALIPTIQSAGEIAISNVLEPTGIVCNALAPNVELAWSNAGQYESIELFRDGILLATLGGSETEYLDTTTVLGETYEYQWVAIFSGVESPPVSCTVTVDNSVPVPSGLACTDVGGAVDLTWQNPGTLYDDIEILRDGVQIALAGGASISFTDSNPPTGIPTTYAVLGIIGGVSSMPSSSCTLTVAEPPPGDTFKRGAINAGPLIDLSDAITLLDSLFGGGEPIACPDAGDTNDDGFLNIADGVYLLTYLFAQGPQPPEPFDTPGVDPTPDALGCGTA